MGSERGSAALAVIGALALATAVGVGVYVVIKDQRAAAEKTAAEVAPPPPVATPAPTPAPEPTPEPVPEAPTAPPAPVDMAEIDAVDPEVGSEPSATNAPVFGTPGVEGMLDKDGIAVAVRAASPKLQRCFEKRLAAGANVGGTLRTTLLVNRRGGVTSATSVGVDDELGTCVTGVLATVRLPRTTDGGTARVVYPIAFHESSPEGSCDEVSCVLNNYEGACCARFHRPIGIAGPPPEPKSPDDLPEQLSRDQLSTALTALRGPVARCASNEDFSGTLKVRFRVQPTGKVSEATIADVEPALAVCVARAFKAHTFPPSVNGVSVSFPFMIQPEER